MKQIPCCSYIPEFRSNNKIVNVDEQFGLKSGEIDIAIGQSGKLFTHHNEKANEPRVLLQSNNDLRT